MISHRLCELISKFYSIIVYKSNSSTQCLTLQTKQPKDPVLLWLQKGGSGTSLILEFLLNTDRLASTQISRVL